MEYVRSLIETSSVQNYVPQLDEDVDGSHFLEIASKNRKRTDTNFLILFGISLVFLTILLGYCFAVGDVKRIIVGYDECGNVCGELNEFQYDFPTDCKPLNMLNKPYFSVDNKTCIEACENNTIAVGYKCMSPTKSSKIQVIDLVEDIQACLPEIIALCFLALGLSCIMLILLRCATAVFVWTSLVGACIGSTSLTSGFWYLSRYDSRIYLTAFLFTVFSIALLVAIIVSKQQIKLAIQLFKEAGKAVSAIPLILFQPILTFIAIGVTVITGIYCMLWILSAGVFTLNLYNYKIQLSQNLVILFSYWFNGFVILWIMQIIYGCESMVVAGAVSFWYFSKNKTGLRGLLWKSARNMLVFHLGTISFGALLIAIVKMLLIVCGLIRRTLNNLRCALKPLQDTLSIVDTILKYITRNGYVITAMYGLKFTQAGIKACTLLIENANTALALSVKSSIILGLTEFVIVAICALSGFFLIQRKEHVQNVIGPLFLIIILCFSIIHSFMTMYKMTIDTILVCFCEDKKINNGNSRPYYMSNNFMELIESAPKILKKKPSNDGPSNAVNSTDADDVNTNYVIV